MKIPFVIYFIIALSQIQQVYGQTMPDRLVDTYKREVERQGYLRLVNEIALKSVEVNDNKLAGLLALQSYKYNVKYEGYLLNALIHRALSGYLEKIGDLPTIISDSDTSKLSEDRKLVRDIEHEGLKTVLSNHFPEVEYLKFSHSGKLLAAKCKGNELYVWNLKQINERPIRIMEKNAVTEFLFSYDDKQVICVFENPRQGVKTTFHSWPLSLDLLAKRICKGISRNLTLEQWRIYIGESMPYEATCN